MTDIVTLPLGLMVDCLQPEGGREGVVGDVPVRSFLLIRVRVVVIDM